MQPKTRENCHSRDLHRLTFAEHRAVTFQVKGGSTVGLPPRLELLHTTRRLLTRTDFHPVSSQPLKGCDLECYVKASLFLRAVKAPLPPYMTPCIQARDK